MNERKKSWLAARKADAKLAYAALMKFYPFTLEDLPNENWYNVDEFEGGYQISTYGRLKSLKRKKPKILKPGISSGGYLHFDLWKDSKYQMCTVHTLVAKAFIPNPENKPEVDHIYGIRLDNYVENLRWVTQLENDQYALELGIKKSGEDVKNAKLTNKQATYIRKVYKADDEKFGVKALAEKFNVSVTTIRNVIKRKTYKNAD
ncbi:MAG: HNH endonuclease [Selenomonadaceae bacterium]|nr:HNH endonuclease [Selenomonadaceae bacterium]